MEGGERPSSTRTFQGVPWLEAPAPLRDLQTGHPLEGPGTVFGSRLLLHAETNFLRFKQPYGTSRYPTHALLTKKYQKHVTTSSHGGSRGAIHGVGVPGCPGRHIHSRKPGDEVAHHPPPCDSWFGRSANLLRSMGTGQTRSNRSAVDHEDMGV